MKITPLWLLLASSVVSQAATTQLNVLSFGADNTGARSSTTAFQAGLDAASQQKGLTLYAPAGRYLISNTIILRGTNLHLLGDGPGATIITVPNNFTPTSAYHWLFSGTNLANVTFEGVTLDGNKAGYPQPLPVNRAGCLINADTVTNFTARFCTFQNNAIGPSVRVSRSEHVIIDHCNFLGAGIPGNAEIADALWVGINSYVQITDNYFEDWTDTGIGMDGTGVDWKVIGNTFNGRVAGQSAITWASIGAVRKMTISNNTVPASNRMGVHCFQDGSIPTNGTEDLVVANNIFGLCKEGAIFISPENSQYLRNAIVTGNTMNNAGGAYSSETGIYFFGNCGSVTIADNQIRNFKGVGILIGGANNFNIHHNTIQNVGQNGATDNGSTGILLANLSPFQATILDANTITDTNTVPKLYYPIYLANATNYTGGKIINNLAVNTGITNVVTMEVATTNIQVFNNHYGNINWLFSNSYGVGIGRPPGYPLDIGAVARWGTSSFLLPSGRLVIGKDTAENLIDVEVTGDNQGYQLSHGTNALARLFSATDTAYLAFLKNNQLVTLINSDVATLNGRSYFTGGSVGFASTNDFWPITVGNNRTVGWESNLGQSDSRAWGMANDFPDYGSFTLLSSSVSTNTLNTARLTIDRNGLVTVNGLSAGTISATDLYLAALYTQILVSTNGVAFGNLTTAPTAASLGANGSQFWSSNTVPYFTYSADGVTATTKEVSLVP